MAELKPQVYVDPRPAEYFTRFHERSRSAEPGWTYELVRMVTSVIALVLYRIWATGVENVPASGPVILAPNHSSNWDHFLTGVYLRRKIRFMAKSQLFKNPVLTYIYTVGGVFPVRRGKHDEEAFITAHSILRRGGCMLIYPEGGRSRTNDLGKPKAGIGRLALESGVPVVPVAIIGSRGIRNWRRLRFPKITIHYGEPMRFPVEADAGRERRLEVAEQVFARVREMYYS